MVSDDGPGSETPGRTQGLEMATPASAGPRLSSYCGASAQPGPPPGTRSGRGGRRHFLGQGLEDGAVVADPPPPPGVSGWLRVHWHHSESLASSSSEYGEPESPESDGEPLAVTRY